jgi:vacuolar-type H+-ATPase subunit E/Vma4
MVMTGEQFDRLESEAEAATARIEWAAAMESARETLNLEAEFAQQGYAWASLDDAGNVVIHDPR